MDIRFYNTLTHGLESFEPIEQRGADGKPHVYMYNCGPTVYDYAHIGNFRAFIFADVLRRFLELTGHTVYQVMNITDVGHMTEDDVADGGGMDKMEAAAQRLKAAGADWVVLAGKPGDMEARLRAAGVDQFVFVGADVLQALETLHAALGLAP